ncbi:phosphatidylethanolamine N-methyltransferase isoform X2 [Scleropages formosus]|uniref:phosphatidylethanolamine N-methyltransferase isoform X2 n=1 Tax=Scleropages formosus TaxID=113540 RepID=UPI00087890C1|nr:phosphatidylethanolamine N-methyltransferase isoform X2 [Scleropages formosus]
MKGADASVRNPPLDCCGGLNNVDFTKVDASAMADALQHIDLTDARFWVAVAAIVFNPFFWNVVARWEHRTRVLTRLFGGPYVACYSLAFLILLLNVYRSHSITAAMKAQARCELLEALPVFYVGSVLMALGSILVFSSFFALGFTGTFLGDYFGILMEEKVTGFPFNVTDNPMYWGSTANYLGLALIPFTEEIYRQRMRCAKQG